MADAGHEATEKLLEKLEKDVAREYKTAVDEMQAKLTAYLEKTEEQRQVQEGLLNSGKITKKEYSDWCFRHNMVGKRWEQMRDTLATDMHHANEIALGITKGRMPDVYALNANYGTYQIEQDGKIDTGFTLYNHDTAEYLLGDQRQLMPKPSAKKAAEIAANKDMQWNQQKIQSAVLQGVLQGESPHKVADRLMQVGQMNYNSAVRYARTMTTSAQNAGRYEAFRRATRLGIDLTIEWYATMDERTRHDHRLMHGQRTTVDQPFHTPDGYTIYYPADCTGSSDAPQNEIWNCRCTLMSWVKGFEGELVTSSPKMGDMTFEEWQNDKEQKQQQQYYKPLDSEAFMKGTYTKEDIERINARFKQLDNIYHANISGITTTLHREQEEYDTLFNNYVDKLLNENPQMRRATAERKTFAFMGERPKKVDIFLGGDYNTETKLMTLNNFGASLSGGISEDIENRKKTLERVERKKQEGGTVRRVFGNAGNTKESDFIHEYGHAVDATYGISNNDKFLQFYKSFTEDEIKLGVSSYAATNEKEFIAECFAESFMGVTQGDISKGFMRLLGEIIQ